MEIFLSQVFSTQMNSLSSYTSDFLFTLSYYLFFTASRAPTPITFTPATAALALLFLLSSYVFFLYKRAYACMPSKR